MSHLPTTTPMPVVTLPEIPQVAPLGAQAIDHLGYSSVRPARPLRALNGERVHQARRNYATRKSSTASFFSGSDSLVPRVDADSATLVPGQRKKDMFHNRRSPMEAVAVVENLMLARSSLVLFLLPPLHPLQRLL